MSEYPDDNARAAEELAFWKRQEADNNEEEWQLQAELNEDSETEIE